MAWTWVDFVVMGLLLLVALSFFLRFPLPKDGAASRRPGKSSSKRFGRFPLEDLKMPEIRLVDEDTPKPADRRLAVWDPERLKLGARLEGVAKLAAIDPTFEEKQFLGMMRELVARYAMALTAKDEDALARMCSPSHMGKIRNAWAVKGWKPRALEKLEDVSILSTRTAGRTAIVEVSVHLRVKGGAAKMAEKPVVERWVVARPFSSEDPTWEIERITTGEEA